MTMPPNRPADAGEGEPKPTPAGCSPTALVLIGLVALICIAGVIIRTVRDSKDEAVDGWDAQVACKEFVERRLKAPATAEFSDLTHAGAGTSWTVTGAVDAENSFGVPIRMNWTCRVHLVGDEWLLDSLTGLG